METDDGAWMVPSARERISEIVLAFRAGVPAAEAAAYIEELRSFPEAVRVEPSDESDAAHMVWFLQTLVIPISDEESLVFTPDPVPSVEYLRRTHSGIWRLWYPGSLSE